VGGGCSEHSSEPLGSMLPVRNQSNLVLGPGKIKWIFIILMQINLTQTSIVRSLHHAVSYILQILEKKYILKLGESLQCSSFYANIILTDSHLLFNNAFSIT
jgi:hypothetical protein